MNISWENKDSYLLVNPKYSAIANQRFQRILKESQEWPEHIWLATSGSSSLKWVGLSKQALLASATAVNDHLKSDKQDCWIHALPNFHVGGLGIWARAYLTGAKVFDFKQVCPEKWQAENFYTYVQNMKGSLTALVPTQLYDLIALEKQAPSSLRAVIIGGGYLPSYLYEKAVTLKWPILPSYGLTECASQVATATLESWKEGNFPSLKLLPHLKGRDQEGRLCFTGSSLLSVYAYLKEEHIHFIDPKFNGWLLSEDRGAIQNQTVQIWGRMDTMIKVGGENVDLDCLESHLHSLCYQLSLPVEATLIAMPDSRLEYAIHLVVTMTSVDKIECLVQHFQQSVLPFEKIRKIHYVSHLPRSALGKILKQDLLQLISVKSTVDCEVRPFRI